MMCLLIRILIMNKQRDNARKVFEGYLEEADTFLKNVSFLPNINMEFSEHRKEVFLKKTNLISTIANLCYTLEMNCL